MAAASILRRKSIRIALAIVVDGAGEMVRVRSPADACDLRDRLEAVGRDRSSAAKTPPPPPSASTNPRRSMLNGREALPGSAAARSVARSLKVAFMLAKPSTISGTSGISTLPPREVGVPVSDHACADCDGMVARCTRALR